MKNSTNKFLSIAVVLLLIANIALVAFMFFGKEKKHDLKEGGKSPFDRMVKEIGMNDAQKKEYDSLRQIHFGNIRPLFDTMRATRQSLFNLMKEDNLNDSLVNVYTSRISEKQVEADKLTLNHFRRVRKLFTPEQQQKFDVFVQKMMQRGKRDSTDKKKD